MSRFALHSLRILAVGGAVTLLACHVMKKQEKANAGRGTAGDRGETGNPPAASQAPVYMSGTKSLQALPTPSPQEDVRILGTKSARVINPSDVSTTSPAPRMFPGSKSGIVITPEELKQMQQQRGVQQSSGQP